MVALIKLFWMIRAIIFKMFFGRFGYCSYLGKASYLSGVSNVHIGSKVRIYPHSRIESLGGIIYIGDNTSIGQCLHLVSARKIVIGKSVTISSNVFISDVDHSYDMVDIHIMEQPLIKLETVVSDNCFLGVGAVILPGTYLGKQCVVGANSVVRGRFPDYSVIAGVPAKIIKRYDFESATWKRTDANGNFICD